MTYVYVAEKLPPELFKELLEKNWIAYKNVPKPDIFVVNDAEDMVHRMDMSSVDLIAISTGGPETIRYRGNVQYYDKAYPIVVEIWTQDSRQRLRDLFRQVKGIIFDHLFAIDGYQIMKLQTYTEMTNDALNIWKAQVKLSIEAAGVCVESNGDYDRFNT
jgi:hypothetical protein